MASGPRNELVRLLRAAHAGEGAAARAYAGHYRAVRDPDQQAAIRRIMQEEWMHRAHVRAMLERLGSGPDRVRDAVMAVVGWAVAASCFVGGWYVPMVGAGRIEWANIREYEVAARWAAEAGRPQDAQALLDMAEVEWDHEAYFHGMARRHPWHRVFGAWPDPPPRDGIRASFREGLPPSAGRPTPSLLRRRSRCRRSWSSRRGRPRWSHRPRVAH